MMADSSPSEDEDVGPDGKKLDPFRHVYADRNESFTEEESSDYGGK